MTDPSVPQTATVNEEVRQLPVEKIVPNRFQPREHFDEGALQELTDSIRDKGVLQPVVVRKIEQDGLFELVIGERRLRACLKLGVKTIPAVIRPYTDEESQEIALIENLQRDDLTLMEEAHSLEKLAERLGGDREAVAQKIGKSVPYVHDRLDLLTLPDKVQELVDEGKVNLAQVKVILLVEGEEEKVSWAEKAVKLNLTANELRGRAQRHMRPDPADGGKSSKSGSITFAQLSNLTVRVFDGIDSFDFAALKDPNKRVTLAKQMALLQQKLGTALQQFGIEAAPAAPPEV